MKWTSALAIYLLFWVMSAFFVLPFHGRKSDQPDGGVRGTDPGAPASLNVRRILYQITIVSAAAFAAYYASNSMLSG
jgi:predicted secreted protein